MDGVELEVAQIKISPAQKFMFPQMAEQLVDNVKKKFMEMSINAIERRIRADENAHLMDMKRIVLQPSRIEDDWIVVEEMWLGESLISRLMHSKDYLEFRIEARK